MVVFAILNIGFVVCGLPLGMIRVIVFGVGVIFFLRPLRLLLVLRCVCFLGKSPFVGFSFLYTPFLLFGFVRYCSSQVVVFPLDCGQSNIAKQRGTAKGPWLP